MARKESQTNEADDRIKEVMRKQLDNLGKTSIHEWSILVCFIILILLWFFREPMFINGWGDLLRRQNVATPGGKPARIDDATPALLMVMVIFALPTNYRFKFNSLGSNRAFKTGSELFSRNRRDSKQRPCGLTLLLASIR